MKRIILISVFTLLVSNAFAQIQDSLFVYKSGVSVKRFAFAEIDTITFKSATSTDSIFFYKNGLVSYKEDLSKIDSIFKGVIHGTVTDIDGNIYPTIRIGSQLWMAQNLRVKTFSDGIPIPLYKDSLPEVELPGMLFYNNNEVNYASSYGGLYNFYTVSRGKLCPAGWHVSSMSDVYNMIGSLGGTAVAGGNMKEAGLVHWNSPNTAATNNSGFNALPAGVYESTHKTFITIGESTTWWSSTQSTLGASYGSTYGVQKDNGTSDIYGSSTSKLYGLSIRCVKDKNGESIVPSITNISNLTKVVGDASFQLNASTNSSSPVLYSIIAGYGAEVTPSGKVTVVSPGTVLINAAVSSNGMYTSNSKTIILKINAGETIKDIDGNTYNLIQIGSQKWFQQNLQTTKYTDGTSIPVITTVNDWSNLSAAGMSFYQNDKATYGNTLGAVYNWKVVNTGKLCPAGAHVPTYTEWNTMLEFIGQTPSIQVGGKIKDAGELYKESIYWGSPNTGATNSSGFSVVAAGYRTSVPGFQGYKTGTRFWTSTVMDAYFGEVRTISLNSSEILIRVEDVRNYDVNGFSVRCIMNADNTPLQPVINNFENLSKNINSPAFKLTAKASSTAYVTYTLKSGTAATVTADGLVTIKDAGVVEIKADAPAKNNYLAASKVITLTISPDKFVVIDIDENIYPVVQIGNQIWMAKSLKVTKLNNGTPISTTAFISQTQPKMAVYNNDGSYGDRYGALYNWHAVNTQKLCPVGWHVPAESEWDELEAYLGGKQVAGGKLKEVGADAYANNQAGFNGALSGIRNDYTPFIGAGSYGTFWSATKTSSTSAISRNFYDAAGFNVTDDFSEESTAVVFGATVRCLKNNDGTAVRSLTSINVSDITKRESDAAFAIQTLSNSAGLITYSVVSGTAATVTPQGMVTLTGTGVVKIKVSVAETATHINLSKVITLTVNPSDVTDIDGNVYKTVAIGNQVWMAENLKVEKYNDGQAIPLITDETLWWSAVNPAMCWYKNDKTTYGATYGALYNSFVVKTQKLCPVGWEVPTTADFATLNTYLGTATAGGSLKEPGTAHWSSPNNTNATTTGFMALPAGKRMQSVGFTNMPGATYFWTATPRTDGLTYFYNYQLFSTDLIFNSNIAPITEGLSVRCIRK